MCWIPSRHVCKSNELNNFAFLSWDSQQKEGKNDILLQNATFLQTLSSPTTILDILELDQLNLSSL